MAWHGEQAKVRIRNGCAKCLLIAAQLLTDRHRINLATRFPPASRRGEFPRYRSGRLLRAVDYDPKTIGEATRALEVTVFVDQAKAPYERKLVRSGRLGVQDTMQKIRPQVSAALAGVRA